MFTLLPIKWFIIQTLIFLVMVAIEAGILHYIEGFAKRSIITYMFLVNLFSFNFGWLVVSFVFYVFTTENLGQDEILSYMLLGIVSEKLLNNLFVNPLADPLFVVMIVYFGAVFYFELKLFMWLRTVILPMGDMVEEIDLPVPMWLDRAMEILFCKDLRLVVTLFVSNVVSHLAAGILIFLAQT